MNRLAGLWALVAVISCNSIAGIEEPNVVDSGKKCTLNSDCPQAWQICAFATCSQACRADRDCPTGLRCLTVEDGKACVTGTKANCSSDSNCPGDGVCRDGQCRNDCSSNLAACLNDQNCSANGACYGADNTHDTGVVSSAGSSFSTGGGTGVGAAGRAAAGTGSTSGGTGGFAVGGTNKTSLGGAPIAGQSAGGDVGSQSSATSWGGASGTPGSGGTHAGATGGNSATGGETVAAAAGIAGVTGGAPGTVGITAGAPANHAGQSSVVSAAGGAPPRQCATDGVISCVESAARARKRCNAGVLENYVACAADELCDTASGNGTCAKVIAACVGRQPGEVFCDGSLRKTCGPDLVSIKSTDCGTTALCQAGTLSNCGLCVTNQYRCIENRLELCNATHTGFDPIKDCGSSPCSAGAGECTTLVCAAAGDRRCNGNVLEACNSTRTAFDTVQTCDVGLCDDVGKQCDNCHAKVSRCATPTSSAQCSDDGQVEQTTDCPSNTPHCVGDGVCVACTPDTQATDCHAPNDCSDAFCSVSSNYTCQLNVHGVNSACHTAGAGNLEGMCTADSRCVQCVRDGQCIAPDECHTGQCSAAGLCNYPQRELDWSCSGGYCSESGTCVPCNRAEQCSAATCYAAACNNHVCSQSPLSSGISCGGTNVCDGGGQCVACVGLGQQTCQSGYVCRSNACTNGLDYLGWRSSSGSTVTLNADVMYLKRIPTLQYPAVLTAFGVNGTGTGASIKFALYADNGTAPTGAPLAQGSALGLAAGARETAAVPNNVALSAGVSYWVAIKLNVTLTAANALVAGTGVPAGESVAESYTDTFRTFSGSSIAGSFGTELSVYLRVQDSQ